MYVLVVVVVGGGATQAERMYRTISVLTTAYAQVECIHGIHIKYYNTWAIHEQNQLISFMSYHLVR